MATIKINKVNYPVKFGLSTIKNFGIDNGMKSVNDFEAWYQKIDSGNLEIIEQMCGLLLLGIQRGCQMEKQECDLTADDILDLVLEAPDTFTELTNILSLSLESHATAADNKSKGVPPKKK